MLCRVCGGTVGAVQGVWGDYRCCAGGVRDYRCRGILHAVCSN